MSDLNVTAISGDVRTPGASTKRRGDGGAAFDQAFDAARSGSDTVTTPREVHGRGRGTSWSRGAAFGLTQQVPGGHPDAIGAGGFRQLRAESGQQPAAVEPGSGPARAAAGQGAQASQGWVAASEEDVAVPAADPAIASAEAALAAAAQAQVAALLAPSGGALPAQDPVASGVGGDAAPGITFLAAGVSLGAESPLDTPGVAALVGGPAAATGVGGAVSALTPQVGPADVAGPAAQASAAVGGATSDQSVVGTQTGAVFSSVPADQPAGTLPGAALAGSVTGQAAVADLGAAGVAPATAAAAAPAAAVSAEPAQPVAVASPRGGAPVGQPAGTTASETSPNLSSASAGATGIASTGGTAAGLAAAGMAAAGMASTATGAASTAAAAPGVVAATPPAPSAAVTDPAVQFSAPDAVAPIDTPGGTVADTPTPPDQSTAPGTPAVDAAPSAPLPGTWGEAVAEATGGSNVAPMTQAPVSNESGDASSPTVGTAPTTPPGATDPGATDTGAGGSGTSPEGSAQTPTAPIPLPVQGAPGDPNSTAPDGELPGVIAPPNPVIVPSDAATPIVQPVVLAPGEGAASRGLVSPVDDSVATLLKPAPDQTSPPPTPATPPVPAGSAAAVSAPASPAANAAASTTSATSTSAPTAQQPADARSSATARETSDAAANPAAATTPADRGVPAFTLPSQPTATPVAPTPSAIITGTPGALPYQQVAGAVGGLLRGPDGTYHVQLNLTPAHLGNVRIMVELRAGEVQIQMLTIDNRTGDLLRGNLDSLRQDLQQMGLRTGHMDVGGGRDESGRRWEGFAGDLSGGRGGNSGSGGSRSGTGTTYRGDGSDARDTPRSTTQTTEGAALDVRV